jgi:hydroxymethylpyrimidine/phosphomethylpyrimidine kinase
VGNAEMPLTNLPFDSHSQGHSDERPRIALTIGGSDPTGGAGIQADLKTFQHFGVHGLSVVTAVTVQNTSGVFAKNAVSAQLVKDQLYALASDLEIDALKIGMLTSVDVVQAVAQFLIQYRIPAVLDPILASSNGIAFLERDAFEILKDELLPLVTIVTPNIPEAEALAGIDIKDDDAVVIAAMHLQDRGTKSVLLKGGHSQGEESRDLFLDGSRFAEPGHASLEWISSPRLAKEVHGTGCVLSSAIASGLAQGKPLGESVIAAKQFIAGMLGHTNALGSGQQLFEYPPFSIN